MANPNYPSDQGAIVLGQVELTRGVTFQFYILEQVMQCDGSNALHLCFCWNQIYKYIVSLEKILASAEAIDYEDFVSDKE